MGAKGPFCAAQDDFTSQMKHSDGKPFAGNEPLLICCQALPKTSPTNSGVYSESSKGVPRVARRFMNGTPMVTSTPYLALSKAAYVPNWSPVLGGLLPVFRSRITSFFRTGSQKTRSMNALISTGQPGSIPDTSSSIAGNPSGVVQISHGLRSRQSMYA